MPVHIALSYDEEVGCRGADDLVEAVAALPQPPFLCVVGEPTGMRVAHANKGKVAGVCFGQQDRLLSCGVERNIKLWNTQNSFDDDESGAGPSRVS